MLKDGTDVSSYRQRHSKALIELEKEKSQNPFSLAM